MHSSGVSPGSQNPGAGAPAIQLLCRLCERDSACCRVLTINKVGQGAEDDANEKGPDALRHGEPLESQECVGVWNWIMAASACNC